MMYRGFVFFFFSFLCYQSSAQEKTQPIDSAVTVSPGDSVIISSEKQVIDIETYAARFDPRKALFYSAILPGAGQVYNKRLWKVPIVYGGFVGGIFAVYYYNNRYTTYKELLFEILNDPAGTHPFTEAQLRPAINRSRRDRDFWIILNGFWYVLQMVEAHVDAHLKEFQLNPQLKVRVEPLIQNDMLTGRTKGLALTIRF